MPVTLDEITTHVRYVDVVLRNSGFPPAEAATMRADMDTFLATTIPQALGDLTDVDTATTPPADGDTLVYVLADDAWVPGSGKGSIEGVYTSDGGGGYTQVSTDTIYLYATAGVKARAGTGGAEHAVLEPEYGGTGSKNLVARSDHRHTTPETTPATYPSKGTLSSGPVTLLSTSIVLPAAGTGEDPKVYRVTLRLDDTQTGQGGSSYYYQKLTIGGTTSTSWRRRTVGGVPIPTGYEYSREITGAGSSVAITAALEFDSGDPLTVEAGGLYIDVECNG